MITVYEIQAIYNYVLKLKLNIFNSNYWFYNENTKNIEAGLMIKTYKINV